MPPGLSFAPPWVFHRSPGGGSTLPGPLLCGRRRATAGDELGLRLRAQLYEGLSSGCEFQIERCLGRGHRAWEGEEARIRSHPLQVRGPVSYEPPICRLHKIVHVDAAVIEAELGHDHDVVHGSRGFVIDDIDDGVSQQVPLKVLRLKRAPLLGAGAERSNDLVAPLETGLATKGHDAIGGKHLGELRISAAIDRRVVAADGVTYRLSCQHLVELHVRLRRCIEPGQSATLSSILPRLSPRKSPARDRGALSNPLMTVSSAMTLPLRSQNRSWASAPGKNS